MEYNGNFMNIVMPIPEDAYKLTVTATVPINDEPREVCTVKNLKDIIENRKDYLLLDPEDDFFSIYKLTPEFKEFAEKMEEDGYDFTEINRMWERRNDK